MGTNLDDDFIIGEDEGIIPPGMSKEEIDLLINYHPNSIEECKEGYKKFLRKDYSKK